MIRMVLTVILAFGGGFAAVGAWIWAPRISSAMSSAVSSGPSVSLFSDVNRIGRAEVAPVLRNCIFRVVDVGDEARLKMEPSAGYFILKAGSMQANIQNLTGKQDMRSDFGSAEVAMRWGQLAQCIYAQDDRELCDADNRAAMVESTSKFFGFAAQAESSKQPLPPGAATAFDNTRDKLLVALKNHRRYGTLTAEDFGSFAPAAITKVLREGSVTRDICKR